MDDLTTSAPALRPDRGAPVRAQIECSDVFALPARLGADPEFYPQAGWSESAQRGVRWLALGAVDAVEVPAGAGFAAAFGAIARVRERLRQLEGIEAAPAALRYLGGLAFDPRDPTHPGWTAGAAARFFLPRILIRQADGRTEATLIGTAGERARRLLQRLAAAARAPLAPVRPLAVVQPAVAGALAQWETSVRAVLAAIEAGAVRKVVLSRDFALEAEGPIDPWHLLRLMHARDQYGLRFCLRFDEAAAFIGASPERLLVQRADAIACDCLAGTIARGTGAEAEARLAAALVASEKDRHEHRIVLEEILAALDPFSEAVEAPEAPRVLRLPQVMHLWSPVRARLKPDVELAALVGALQPTPAVGGSPRAAALDLIRALEGRPRGWYAGLVGWIGAAAADFAVAIRSGVVRGSRLTAVAGAGIVRGSESLAEWDETARKAASFVRLFSEDV